jgi:hypothetical protein
MAWITPSILDENPGNSAATHTGLENWLNDEHIFSSEKFCSSQAHQRESLRETHKGCHL